MNRLEKFEGWSGHPEWVADVMHVILYIFIPHKMMQIIVCSVCKEKTCETVKSISFLFM